MKDTLSRWSKKAAEAMPAVETLILLTVLWCVSAYWLGRDDRYPMKDFWGDDGEVYVKFTQSFQEFWDKNVISRYYIKRCLPIFLVAKWHSVSDTPTAMPHILATFSIFNAIVMSAAGVFFVKTLEAMKVSIRGMLLGVVLFLFNWSVSKYPYYYAHTTDAFAILIGFAASYFWMRRSTLGLGVVLVMGAFAWPYVFMLLVPPMLVLSRPAEDARAPAEEADPKPTSLTWLATAGTGAVLVVFTYFALQVHVPGSLPWARVSETFGNVDVLAQKFGRLTGTAIHPLLPISAALAVAAGVYPVYALTRGMPIRMPDRAVFFRLIAVGGVMWILSAYQENHSVAQMYTEPAIEKARIQMSLAVGRPLQAILGHFAHFGPAVAFALVFWRPIARVIRRLGTGYVVVSCLAFVMLVLSESRQFNPVFGILLPVIVKGVDEAGVRSRMIAAAAFFGVGVSKIWLALLPAQDPATWKDAGDSVLQFPVQLHYMSWGNLMGTRSYVAHAFALAALAALLYVWSRAPEGERDEERDRETLAHALALPALVLGTLVFGGFTLWNAYAGPNVAKRAKVTASTPGIGAPQRLIDGIIQEDVGFSTAPGVEGSVTLDLGRTVRVTSVTVHGPARAPYTESLPIVLEASSDGTAYVEVARRTEVFSAVAPWRAGGAGHARYLRFRGTNPGRLSFTEVLVRGR